MKTAVLLLAIALQSICNNGKPNIFIKNSLEKGSLSNIYMDYGSLVMEGKMSLSFGDCQSGQSMYNIAQIHVNKDTRPGKFVWYVPENININYGCLRAEYATGDIFAQSGMYTINEKIKATTKMYNLSSVYMDSDRTINQNHAVSKDTKIGIIGAGISGLFSGFLLDQAGLHNYDILEVSKALGGRMYTAHFDNSTKNYQDMGAMHLPVEIQYDNGKKLPVNDHAIVFQLAEELNSLNEDSYSIEFINWWTERENNLYYKNGFRLPNGRIPTVAEVNANPNLVPREAELKELTEEADAAEMEYFNEDWYKLMSKDMYAAHAKAMDVGYDDWTEWGLLHNKRGLSLKATNGRVSERYNVIWADMVEHFAYMASSWKAINGGFHRLAAAFAPLIGNKIQYNTKVTKIESVDGKLSVQWKDSPTDDKYNSKSYDNVIVSVPFSVVSQWHLPELNFDLKTAIQGLNYNPACKVALEFSSRFWEKYKRPIFGGCDVTDLMSGKICYPTNDFGTDGHGIVLASYVYNKAAATFSSMKEEDHVQRVLDDFTELHGDLVKKYYTGKYERVCWSTWSEFGGAWGLYGPGQHKLFRPSYLKIDHGLVFVGEHTNIRHAWVSSALESAIRGVAMILVEKGHIDEAKLIIRKYNAYWLSV